MLKELIYKRKSIRNYQTEKLTAAESEKIEQLITEATALLPEIKYRIVIADKVSSPFKINAPAYLLFYSEEKPGYLENLGFLGQQLSLKLLEAGYGSCWQGMVKPRKTDDGLLPLITMSFGKPAEELFRNLEDFNRKPLLQIANIESEYTQVARLAPSAMNAQDWYFQQVPGFVHCYHRKADFPLRTMLGKMAGMDLGIALYHLSLLKENYRFVKVDHSELADCEYFISLEI